MEHSPMFDDVKRFYDNGLWSATQVYDAVGRWITPEEYNEIVGEPYSAK